MLPENQLVVQVVFAISITTDYNFISKYMPDIKSQRRTKKLKSGYSNHTA
jgi:hypothetical protein